MGGVRTKTVKRAARQVIEAHYTRLGLDFDVNKRVLDNVAVIQSKRLRNQVAGYITHLMKRIQAGPVHGISLKLQEEERERKDNYVPDVSAFKVDEIEVDEETLAMVESLGFKHIETIKGENERK
ncbi:ribosomal protein S17e [Kipferlia bialata]|uniref:Ribosomal protein S17e n=1 Tax=Kipferlia bialata TaxID=797122 RepID=A0A391P2S7_9EUKA|nr:ribosomal protein S17e [Kipferlia bialata]|eukprot:g5786.t1